MPLLAEHFLRIVAADGKARPRFCAATRWRRSSAHHWPGNVRELRNAIERAVVLGQGRGARRRRPLAQDDPRWKSLAEAQTAREAEDGVRPLPARVLHVGEGARAGAEGAGGDPAARA